MSSKTVMSAMIGFYIAIFFLYLFGPLAVMSVTAFNTPNYPTAWPFEGFTLDWFVKLWNHRAMMEGLRNSIIIGLGVVAVSVPVGLAAGRLGNFINGELWGRVTDLPWGMLFRDAGPLPRHPSQLYQMGLEGLALFALLWWFSSRPRPRARVSALFLMGYGTARCIGEFAREPDAFLGFLALGLTMGQWLSLPMIAAGAVLWLRGRGDAAR